MPDRDHDDYSSGDESIDTGGRYSSDSSTGHRMPKKAGPRGGGRGGYGPGGRRSGPPQWGNGMDVSYSYNVPSDVDAAYRMQAMRGGGPPITMPPRNDMRHGGYGPDPYVPLGTPLNGPTDGARALRRSKTSETRGYRVLHNSHVDLLSPNGVLECRESATKVGLNTTGQRRQSSDQVGVLTGDVGGLPDLQVPIGEPPIGSTRLPKKLTEEDVLKASANCGGEHGTEHCTCIQIEHDGHICYIVDGRLVHRTPSGAYEDHGEFRILDDDFLAFYEGIESLVQDQSSAPRAAANSITNSGESGAAASGGGGGLTSL